MVFYLSYPSNANICVESRIRSNSLILEPMRSLLNGLSTYSNTDSTSSNISNWQSVPTRRDIDSY